MIECRHLLTIGIGVSVFHAAAPARAQSYCDDSKGNLALTAGVAAGAGATASVGSSALAATLATSRNYNFARGTLLSVGITAGLAGLYAIVDGSSGCRMAEGGIAWSVPITTFVVGAAIPWALWGASDKSEPTATAQEQLVTLRWRF